MNNQRSLLVLVVILIAVGGTAFWYFNKKAEPPVVAETTNQNGTPIADPNATGGQTTIVEPATQPAQPDSSTETTQTAAVKDYNLALELMKQRKLVDARTAMNKAYYSGNLPADLQEKAIPVLEQLADETLLSSVVYDGDPYVYQYKTGTGQVLQNIEREQRLHVPPTGLMMINRIADARKIQAGQSIKLIKGPFRAVVRKGDFTMDLYLQRDDLPKVFVKRMKVGLGANGSTPCGTWRVKLGNKLRQPPYTPTPNSPNRDKGTIPYGRPGYAFGTKGLWIALEGTDPNTAPLDNYGIHSTNHPESIGTAGSEGCIRMSDKDIQLVFDLLYEKWSTVDVQP